MPREPQKKRGGGGYKVPKTKTWDSLTNEEPQPPSTDFFPPVCVSITMLIFLSNTGGYGQTIFFFFFLWKQFFRVLLSSSLTCLPNASHLQQEC